MTFCQKFASSFSGKSYTTLTTNFILIYPRRLGENIFSSFSFMPLCSSFSYIDPSRKLSDTVLLVL